MKKLHLDFVSTLTSRFCEKSPLIQVLLGPRQVGKTTGTLQFLKVYAGKSHYALADDILSSGRTWLLEQWQKAKSLDHAPLLVIDEIQKIQNWQEIIKKLWDEQSIHSQNKIKVLLLASSSLSLQSGLTESLAGRYEKINVYHWNFKDSKRLHEKMDLDLYLRYGGYPKSYEFIDEPKRWYEYVKSSIINMAIDRDILGHANVKKPALFRQTFELLSSYPSQEISFTKILGQLQDKGNTDLVKYYIQLYESAFLFKALPKYSNQAYKKRSSSPKIIPLAPCFYSIVESLSEEKKSWVFESTVGAALLRVTDDLYYWREKNFEVDFVVKLQGKVYAIEVKSGRKKSQRGLEVFCNKFPKAIALFITTENYEQFLDDPEEFLSLSIPCSF